jgi:hypothetical protein
MIWEQTIEPNPRVIVVTTIFKQSFRFHSSFRAIEYVVDFGFQHIFPPFLTVKHPSGWNFNCIVFSTKFVLAGLGCQPNAQPPTWRTRVSLLVWNLTLDLSGLGGPASSYATAGIVREIIGARKPRRGGDTTGGGGFYFHYSSVIQNPPLYPFSSVLFAL